eukprot:TRINITY_DN297_c0_g1_i7.p1 TRINITY_DN297_c0_g1~~TRINITY_DN297_c0_g1_i7.p1  ORF type:complete len:242 (+),score=52.79 TRINITY_DN297_c0_g1_i7:87-812(+)
MYHTTFFFFFNDTATTEIYTRSIVGSVRCVQETGVHGDFQKWKTNPRHPLIACSNTTIIYHIRRTPTSPGTLNKGFIKSSGGSSSINSSNSKEEKKGDSSIPSSTLKKEEGLVQQKRAKSLNSDPITLEDIWSTINSLNDFLIDNLNTLKEDNQVQERRFSQTVDILRELAKNQHEAIVAQNEGLKSQNIALNAQMQETQRQGMMLEKLFTKAFPDLSTSAPSEKTEETKDTHIKQDPLTF